MADEVTDCSNKEQFIICFRWVDKGFTTHEDFIGSYNVHKIKADTLVTVIKDVLMRLNIPLSNARGQCYYGAKNMCGLKNRVSNKILSENPKALFTRCFGHALKLAVGDMVKNARFLKDCMGTTDDISKRDAMLQKIRKDISLEYPGFKVLCPKMNSKGVNQRRSFLTTGLLYNTFGMNHLMEIWNQKSKVEFFV